jgi:hypothetical protein
MEQVKEKIFNKDNNIACKKVSFLKKDRILFSLKDHCLVQKSIINTLLIKNNWLIEDLAYILQVSPQKLHRVWLGKDRLTKKKSFNLICLFYTLFSYVDPPFSC